MEWRIRKTSDGDFMAEFGTQIESGIPAEYVPGYFMPGFIVREFARFDTMREAKAYVKRKERKAGKI